MRSTATSPTTPVDYVLLDCPPSLGLLTLNALVAATEILIPIQCEYYALEGVSQLVRTIDLVKGELNDQLRLSTVLLTMFERPYAALRAGRRRGPVPLPRRDAVRGDPALGPDLGGTELRAVRPDLPPGLRRSRVLPEGGRGDRPPRSRGGT